MQLFQWDKALQTGNPEIDEQHQHLIGIINEFGELMERNAAGPDEIELVCAKLAEYAASHFDLEYQLMEKFALDPRHRHQHRHQHEDLIYETEQFRNVFAAGDPTAGKIFFEFLTNWLVFHVIGTDMLMARQIVAIRQGKTVVEAYLSEERDNQNATGLLLRAVKNLLSQISSRNKQLVELNETLERRVQERTADLTALNQQLHTLANTDDLTGTLSRRAFMEEACNLVHLAQRYKHPTSLLMIDVDHFKRVNDTYGHQTGDRVLAHLSRLMQQCLRGTDRFGRVGGEEFAVILPETDLEQTALLIERLLSTVRSATLEMAVGSPLTVTISIGVSTLTPTIADIDALMKMADNALYQAKSTGRDRWCTAT